MGKVHYKKSSIKFDKIVPSTNDLVTKKNLIRGNNVTEIFKIDVNRIISFEKQARKIFNEKELINLADSIREVGITSPLLLIKDEEQGKFQVINGERRLKAAKIIGLDKVPCIIIDNNEKSELMAIVDNIQRADLHPVELSNAYQSFIKTYGDKKSVSEKIGVPYSSFVETLKLNKLPEEIKNYLLSNNIKSRSIFRKILKSPNLEEMKKILGIINKNDKINRKKNLLEVSIKNDDIECKLSNIIMSASERKSLLIKLYEIIHQLEDQKD